MLTDIGRGDQHLGEGDGVVREEVELQVVLGVGIVVDDACNVDDETDGLKTFCES